MTSASGLLDGFTSPAPITLETVSIVAFVNRALGERVQVIRGVRRMTLTELQRRSGIDVSVLRDLEAGVAWPTLLMLHRLAEALEVSLPLLVDEKATPLKILRLFAANAA